MDLFAMRLAAAQQAGGGNMIVTLLPMILIFAVMYFLMIRPQKKREKALREKINAMQVGDTVLTIGGIVGKVMNIANDEVTISTSVANTMLTFKKTAIGTVVSAGQAAGKTQPATTEKSDEEKSKKKWFKRESDVE